MRKLFKRVISRLNTEKKVPIRNNSVPVLFSYRWYIKNYLHKEVSREEAYRHYLNVGWKKGYQPTPLFEPTWYLDMNPAVKMTGEEPFEHYINLGWKEGRKPNQWFDPVWYLDAYPEIKNTGQEPLSHYIKIGSKLKYKPSNLFDEDEYLRQNPFLKSSKIVPFVHYISHQRAQIQLVITPKIQLVGVESKPKDKKKTAASEKNKVTNVHSIENKTIFIHIGLPKTATSSIQVGLWNNRELLKKKGFLYPETGIVASAHHNIAFEIRDDRRFNPSNGTLYQLIDEINSSPLKNVILSSEQLAEILSGHLEDLRLAFEQCNVKVIAFLRRQDQFLQSYWAQLVKTGYVTDAFDEWGEKLFSRKLTNYAMWGGNYLLLLEEWSKLFGRESIIVRPFEKSQIQQDIFIEFLNICGIEATAEFEIPKLENITPSFFTLETIRKFNKELSYLDRYDLHITQEEGTTFSETITSLVAKYILDYSVINGWNQSKVNLTDENRFIDIMKHFNSINQQISDLYLNGSPLFIEKFKKDQIDDAKQLKSLNLDEQFYIDLNTYVLRRLFSGDKPFSG